MKDEWEVTVVYDMSVADKAEETVASAMVELERGSPGVPRIHAKRQERASRFHQAMRDKGLMVAIVGQWLSEKQKQSAATGAKEASQIVARLADDVEQLRRKLAEIEVALRFAKKTEVGDDIVECAGAASGALKEALPHLHVAQDAARRIDAIMPSNAKGAAGIIGALRHAPPDDALAAALARHWRSCGLSLNGGEDGDGIDVVLESILGKGPAGKALTRARARMSTEISSPQ